MKNTILVITLLAVGIAAFSFIGQAHAQSVTPQYPGNGGPNGGRGGNVDGTGVPMERNVNLDGELDDLMAGYLADTLGIEVDDLKAREEAGETLVEIGLSLGFDEQAILEIHTNARINALNQAVLDGTITQTQADWLISRLEMGQRAANFGTCEEDCSQTMQKFMSSNRRGFGLATP